MTAFEESNLDPTVSDDLIDELDSLIVPGFFLHADLRSGEPIGGESSLPPGTVVADRYAIRSLVGAGGMGQVYDAMDESLRRRVALKVLNRRNPFAAELMKREREVLASLEHPGIVAVYDCGELIDGQPFFVMQFVEGEDFRSFIHSRALSLRETISLVAKVTRAVGVAHLLAIVHRDLKPQNITVTADGRPMVLDFGLAKFQSVEDSSSSEAMGDSARTVTLGRVKGTLAYMSPEQAAGETVDSRSDVYALGVILFELLTGGLPNDPTETSVDVQSWSQFLRSHRPRPCRELDPQIPRDLASIVDKSLCANAADRYPTAMELAHDLELFLKDRPVSAVVHRRRLYVAGKFVKQHRYKLAAACCAAAVLVVVVVDAFRRIQTERNIAVAESRRAEEREAVARPFLYASEMRQGQLYADKLDFASARTLLDRQIPRQGEPDLRGFEWTYLDERLHQVPSTLTGLKGKATHLAMDSTGKFLFSGDDSGEFLIWDVERKSVAAQVGKHRGGVVALAVNPDATLAATAGEDKALKLWDLKERRPIADLVGGLGSPAVLAFLPDGNRLAAADRAGLIQIWNCKERKVESSLFAFDGRPIRCLDVSSDAKLLATAGRDNIVRLWDLPRRKRLTALPKSIGPVHVVRFTPDGQYVATGGWDRSLKYFKTSGDFAKVYDGQFSASSPILDVRFQENGNALTALSNGLAAISQPPPVVRPIRDVRIEPDRLQAVALSKNGVSLACTDDGTSIQVWNLPSTVQYRRIPLEQSIGRLALNPTRPEVAVVFSFAPIVEIWNLETQQRLGRIQAAGPGVLSTLFTPDGSTLWTASVEGALEAWDAHTGQRQGKSIPLGRTTTAMAASSDGKRFAVGSIGNIELRAFDGSPAQWRAEAHASLAVSDLAFSPDGELLASAGWDNTVQVWETSTGRRRFTLAGVDEAVFRTTISPDGQWLAASGRNGAVVVWELATGKRAATFTQPFAPCLAIAFSANSRSLAIGVDNPGKSPAPILLFDLATRIPTLSLDQPMTAVGGTAFLSDGRRLVAAGAVEGGSGAIVIWGIPNWRPGETIAIGGAAGGLKP